MLTKYKRKYGPDFRRIVGNLTLPILVHTKSKYAKPESQSCLYTDVYSYEAFYTFPATFKCR